MQGNPNDFQFIFLEQPSGSL